MRAKKRSRGGTSWRRWVRGVTISILICLLGAGSCPGAAGRTAPTLVWPEGCSEEELGGQRALFCLPDDWNGVLVVYAHGNVPAQQPVGLPLEELDSLSLPEEGSLVEFLLEEEFAFVTGSYSKNGYAVEQAGEDLTALVARFAERVAPERPGKVLLVGASEGALIAVQLLEEHPETYHGALALCGPIGGASYQVRYLNDFRVVFDYYFPDVFAFGSADVPQDGYLDWGGFEEVVRRTIPDQPDATEQLFRVTGAAQDPLDPTDSAITTTLEILHYSIWGANDLIATSGGIPYDNLYRVYSGSREDAALNAGVERVSGDPEAEAYLRRFYQPTGELTRPLVTLHTTRDPVVPFGHELLYSLFAVRARRSAHLTMLRVPRYGHCSFTREEVVGAFALLVYQSTGERHPGLEQRIPFR